MLLTARLLKDVSDVNHFGYAEVLEFVEGDTPTLYLQLADEQAAEETASWDRYIPAAGAVLSVKLQSIDSAKTIVRDCRNPFPEDRSVFCFDILPADVIAGTRALKLKLTEGQRVTNGYVAQAISVRPASPEF